MKKQRKAPKHKEAWEKTKVGIFGENPRVDESASNWNEEAFCLNESSPGKTSRISHSHFKTLRTYDPSIGKMVSVIARDEYGVAKDKAVSWGNQRRYLLMHRLVMWDVKYLYDSWGPVGEYDGENIGILFSHRGKGVGFTFIRWLLQHNILKSSIGYSPGGYRTIEKAHKSIIEEAIQGGKQVPDEVLADYPEFCLLRKGRVS